MLDQARVRNGDSFHQFKKESKTDSFANDFTKYIDQHQGQTYFWKPGKFHVVTDPKLAKAVLKNPTFSADRSLFFMSRMPNLDLNLINDFFGVVKKMMVMADGKDHFRKRSASNLGFEDHIIEKFRSKVDKTVADLVQNSLRRNPIQFVEDVANKLPSTVLADLFSIPQEDRETFQQWSLNMTAFFGGGTGYENEDGIKVNNSALKLREYFSRLIDERTKNPGIDYVSCLLQNQERFSLTKDEVISQAIMMLVAGQVTTSDQICNNMFQLAQDPTLQQELKEKPELISPALEELTRFDPAVTFIFRVAAEDSCIGDQPIKKGETIFISSHAINRNAVENGYEVNIHRKNPQAHFSYGFGPHFCIGAKLARLEMETLFRKIMELYPLFEVELATRDHYSLSFSGFKSLNLRPRQ